MSTNNIAVKNIPAYTKGFNLGYQAADLNKKLTSITASIYKSVFHQDYNNSFYQGVAEGWQHCFDIKRQKLKKQVKEPPKEQPQTNRMNDRDAQARAMQPQRDDRELER